MPEVRQDSLLGHWVIIAPERALRPIELVAEVVQSLERCPFCRGHEDATPDAVLVVPTDSSDAPSAESDWSVRVVPNRYPAVVGQHEVIIEAPTHETSLARVSDDQFTRIATAYRSRLRTIRELGQSPHVSLFKNSGAAAGASLQHVHSQLIATPFVSENVARKLAAGADYWRRTGGCAWCELIERERTAGQRLVFETAGFSVLCPFASRFAAELLIVPRRHAAHFDHLSDDDLHDFSCVLRSCLARLENYLPGAAYNVVFQTAPFAHDGSSSFHWHVEILPRINGLAGFEVGSGNAINTIPPEVAAVELRQAARGF